MNRRDFLAAASTGALLALTPACAPAAVTPTTAPGATPTTGPATAPKPFALDSPPVLQNPAPDAVTVAWAVNGRATGWVEYGPTRELGQRAAPSTRGLIAVADRFLSVRLTGLSPGKPVYYRVVSVPVTYRGAYKIERGEPVASPVYRFTPIDPAAATARFAAINDTHENATTLPIVGKALAEAPLDLIVHLGDACKDVHTEDQIAATALRWNGATLAAERPLLFAPGNHETRGPAARLLPQALTPWPGDPALARCFAVRQGPLALIGLDTGEDKPDRHPAWFGLAAFEPYRAAQRDWLAATLRRPEIAGAPYLVICCHIPLFGLPGDNPGDTLEGFAAYCRHAQQLWHPLLAAARPQLLLAGHTHKHRFDAPTAERPYAQLIGGGPTPKEATVTRGDATAERLRVTQYNLEGQTLGEWTFAPRRPDA